MRFILVFLVITFLSISFVGAPNPPVVNLDLSIGGIYDSASSFVDGAASSSSVGTIEHQSKTVSELFSSITNLGQEEIWMKSFNPIHLNQLTSEAYFTGFFQSRKESKLSQMKSFIQNSFKNIYGIDLIISKDNLPQSTSMFNARYAFPLGDSNNERSVADSIYFTCNSLDSYIPGQHTAKLFFWMFARPNWNKASHFDAIYLGCFDIPSSKLFMQRDKFHGLDISSFQRLPLVNRHLEYGFNN